MDTWGALTNATSVISRDDLGSVRKKAVIVSVSINIYCVFDQNIHAIQCLLCVML